nr:hypothetical protein BaRGS_014620 [Batillaria attramentaria]
MVTGEQERQDLKDIVSELTTKNRDLEKRVVNGDHERQKLSYAMALVTTTLKLSAVPPQAIKSELDSDQDIAPSVLSSHDVFARSDDHNPLEPVVNQLSQKMTEVSADVQALKNANTQQDVAIQEAGSSVYVRWGRSTCPSTSSLVYSGVIGGSHYTQSGAASNYLCLSLSPVLSDHPIPSSYASLYGGEYETHDSHQNKDPVCAVCRSQHPTTIMVPGTNVCQPGWTTEYSGNFMWQSTL